MCHVHGYSGSGLHQYKFAGWGDWNENGDTICVPTSKIAHQVRTLSRVDVLVNIIIPMIAMCVLNSMTCVSVVQIDRNRKVVIRTVRMKNKTKLLDLTLQRRPRMEGPYK